MKLALPLQEADRAKWAQLADGLAAAVVASLPWSTSLTSALIVIWLIVVLPTLDPASVRREVMSPAGGLPVLLWLLGVIGMLWAGGVSLQERLAGLSGFHRLLVIPLLLAQFRRSENIDWVIRGFLASCAAVLVLSGISLLVPKLQSSDVPGVPLKDYIAQAAWFQICLFGLLYYAIRGSLGWRRRLLFGALAVAFLVDIAYIASSRTALVVMPVLLLLLGIRRFGWKGLVGACVVGAIAAGALWASSSYLRARIGTIFEEARVDRTAAFQSSTGQRLEFWRKSFGFVQQAPVLGHGTGSIKALFQKAAVGDVGAASVAADNPHQQTFVIAIQLGIMGAAILWAMWIAHWLLFFRAPGLVGWLGLVVVTQNIIGSLFNSHLFDFNQGWLYVFGFGILGGAVLRQNGTPESGENRA